MRENEEEQGTPPSAQQVVKGQVYRARNFISKHRTLCIPRVARFLHAQLGRELQRRDQSTGLDTDKVYFCL